MSEVIDKNLKNAVIAGNFLKVSFRSQRALLVWLMTKEFHQVSVLGMEISTPLDKDEKKAYAWLIRRAGGNPYPKGEDDGDKPTPPTGPRGTPTPGGSPAGGVVGHYIDTVAIAA